MMKCLVILLATCIGLGYATELLKKYDIFLASDKTKWIQVSQLEPIFSAIEENLREMNENIKRDNSAITQLSTNVQSISNRLQGIEELLARIERTGSYSKAQLQQFSEGSIKEEVQIDQISHRLEKNHQLLSQRLNDVDSNLGTILKMQDVMEKEIRKINVAQNTLTDNVDELSQHTKLQSTKILQNITNAQQELHQKLKDTIKNTPAPPEEKVRIITSSIDQGKSGINQSKSNQNDDTRMEWTASLFNVEHKVNEIKSQAQSMEVNLLECTDVVNKIYNKLDSKSDDWESYMKDQFSSLLDQMKQQNSRDLNELELKFRKNFESISNKQTNFTNSCYRLQLNEIQMEEKAVEILEKLFNYLDNRTYEIQHDIENLILRTENVAENYTAPHFNWNVFTKPEEKLEIGRNNTSSTQSDAFSPPVIAANKVPKTQRSYQKKLTMQREWLPNENPEKVYLADEPQKLPTFALQKEQPISAAVKVKFAYKTQPVNVVQEISQIPEHFFGIEGLSRTKRSARSLK